MCFVNDYTAAYMTARSFSFCRGNGQRRHQTRRGGTTESPEIGMPSKCRLFHLLEEKTLGLWKASRASGYPRPPLGGRTRTPLRPNRSPQITKKRR